MVTLSAAKRARPSIFYHGTCWTYSLPFGTASWLSGTQHVRCLPETRFSGPYGAQTLSQTVQLELEICAVAPQQRELTPYALKLQAVRRRAVVCIPERYSEGTPSLLSSSAARTAQNDNPHPPLPHLLSLEYCIRVINAMAGGVACDAHASLRVRQKD
jgi:hypothetical protein